MANIEVLHASVKKRTKGAIPFYCINIVFRSPYVFFKNLLVEDLIQYSEKFDVYHIDEWIPCDTFFVVISCVDFLLNFEQAAIKNNMNTFWSSYCFAEAIKAINGFAI